jgi:hypothetical protein
MVFTITPVLLKYNCGKENIANLNKNVNKEKKETNMEIVLLFKEF